jgi:hypothetical protein
MENNTTKRVDDIMSSLDGIDRATANPFLAGKIRHRIQSYKQPVLSRQWSWRLVAAMLAIVLLNAVTIQYMQDGNNIKNKEAKAIATEYSISLSDTY